MKFYLIVSRGRHRGMPIPIEIDLFVIGSGDACQLRASHPSLGGQHCALVMRGRRVFVRDLGSGFPTCLNGREIPTSEEWPVHKGDTLTVGPLEFRISYHEKQLSRRDLEEWATRTLDEDTGPRKSAFDELDETYWESRRQHDEAAQAAAAIINQLQAQKGVLRGRLRIAREGPVTVVRINDIYLVEEAELGHLKKELMENLDVPDLKVLLDFKNVRRMSSAAVKMFGMFSQWLKQRNGSLALCRLRPDLANMLYDLQSVFDFKLFRDKEAALAGRW